MPAVESDTHFNVQKQGKLKQSSWRMPGMSKALQGSCCVCLVGLGCYCLRQNLLQQTSLKLLLLPPQPSECWDYIGACQFTNPYSLLNTSSCKNLHYQTIIMKFTRLQIWMLFHPHPNTSCDWKHKFKKKTHIKLGITPPVEFSFLFCQRYHLLQDNMSIYKDTSDVWG